MADPAVIRVFDGTGDVAFHGALLATASSRRPDSQRWSELALYRTEGGSYVLQRIGRSRLYHAAHCTRSSGSSSSLVPPASLPAASVPCECVPVDGEWADGDLVAVESDIHHVSVQPSAALLVSSLRRTDSRGVTYLTSLQRTLLSEAALRDPEVGSALSIRYVI